MKKSKGVAYISRKITTTSRSEMQNFIADSPLKKRDRDFMTDILEGLSYKELESKYNKSQARIAQWKRTVFETLQRYEYESIRK